MLSWTPEGFVGQRFATMKPFMAPVARHSAAAAVWSYGTTRRRITGRTSPPTETSRPIRTESPPWMPTWPSWASGTFGTIPDGVRVLLVTARHR